MKWRKKGNRNGNNNGSAKRIIINGNIITRRPSLASRGCFAWRRRKNRASLACRHRASPHQQNIISREGSEKKMAKIHQSASVMASGNIEAASRNGGVASGINERRKRNENNQKSSWRHQLKRQQNGGSEKRKQSSGGMA
jgi:hypothetical protein